NDDTHIYPDALKRLMQAHASLPEEVRKDAIMVGSLRSPDSGELTYGGYRRVSRAKPLSFVLVPPGDSPLQCDVFNGNIVLIPERVKHAVGNLHPRFRHRGGDFEYALRASRHGVTHWVAPGVYGECSRNTSVGTWADVSLPARVR